MKLKIQCKDVHLQPKRAAFKSVFIHKCGTRSKIKYHTFLFLTKSAVMGRCYTAQCHHLQLMLFAFSVWKWRKKRSFQTEELWWHYFPENEGKCFGLLLFLLWRLLLEQFPVTETSIIECNVLFSSNKMFLHFNDGLTIPDFCFVLLACLWCFF